MKPVSDALMELLRRQELRGKTVGAVKPHLMEWANDLLDQEEDIDDDHSPAARGGSRAKLCWVNPNPAFRKTVGRRTNSTTFLKVVR